MFMYNYGNETMRDVKQVLLHVRGRGRKIV